uniref:Uncharacterized protein n=1 Tax=Rhizophora mucronata TaxID=61149 RepID=A0A2P2Q4G1_RHIMU
MFMDKTKVHSKMQGKHNRIYETQVQPTTCLNLSTIIHMCQILSARAPIHIKKGQASSYPWVAYRLIYSDQALLHTYWNLFTT